MGIVAAARTDIGRRRKANEDEVLALPGLGPRASWVLLAVADGIGGAQGGSKASQEAMRVLRVRLANWNGENPAGALREAFARANDHLLDIGRRQAIYKGMGTTLVAALIDGREAWVANVGDSRAYHITIDSVRQVTEDHSLVADQVRAGYIDERAAASSPRRNVITRSLGGSRSMTVDVFGPLELQAGESLLLCSDGLHGVVSDSEIAGVSTTLEPDAAVRRLISMANDRGGPDNISVVLARAA